MTKYDIRHQSRIRLMRLERQITSLTAMIDGARIQLDALAKELEAERLHYAGVCADLELPEIVPVRMEIE